jgi:hypothetical protein
MSRSPRRMPACDREGHARRNAPADQPPGQRGRRRVVGGVEPGARLLPPLPAGRSIEGGAGAGSSRSSTEVECFVPETPPARVGFRSQAAPRDGARWFLAPLTLPWAARIALAVRQTPTRAKKSSRSTGVTPTPRHEPVSTTHASPQRGSYPGPTRPAATATGAGVSCCTERRSSSRRAVASSSGWRNGTHQGSAESPPPPPPPAAGE